MLMRAATVVQVLQDFEAPPTIAPRPPTTVANLHIDRSLGSKETHIQSHNRVVLLGPQQDVSSESEDEVTAGSKSRKRKVLSLNSIPKLHYLSVTRVTGKFRGSRRLVTGKSPTWIMLRGSRSRNVSGSQTIATCRDGLKSPRDKSATSPFASGKRGDRRRVRDKCDTGKSAKSRANQRGCHGFVADLSRTSPGSRHSGIWALRRCRQIVSDVAGLGAEIQSPTGLCKCMFTANAQVFCNRSFHRGVQRKFGNER